MIKGITGLMVFTMYMTKMGRLPDKDEFMKMGYSRSAWYKTKKQWDEMKEEDKQWIMSFRE